LVKILHIKNTRWKSWIPQRKSSGIIATRCAKYNRVIAPKKKLHGKKKINGR
jgi:hypothetical protein